MTPSIALDLHTDLANVKTYAGQNKPELVNALIVAAREKIAAIEAQLDQMATQFDQPKFRIING
jgi:hypothetical protein